MGVKKDELESKAKLFQNNVDDTGGIIYSGSTSYSWFFRPAGQAKSSLNSSYWPAQYDAIDVYRRANPKTGNKEIVRYYAHSPIASECESTISHYSRVESSYRAPEIIEINE